MVCFMRGPAKAAEMLYSLSRHCKSVWTCIRLLHAREGGCATRSCLFLYLGLFLQFALMHVQIDLQYLVLKSRHDYSFCPRSQCSKEFLAVCTELRIRPRGTTLKPAGWRSCSQAQASISPSIYLPFKMSMYSKSGMHLQPAVSQKCQLPRWCLEVYHSAKVQCPICNVNTARGP